MSFALLLEQGKVTIQAKLAAIGIAPVYIRIQSHSLLVSFLDQQEMRTALFTCCSDNEFTLSFVDRGGNWRVAPVVGSVSDMADLLLEEVYRPPASLAESG